MSIASKLSTISQNMNTLYNKAYTKGYAEGNKEWDRFWDTFQQKGNRKAYNFGFINCDKNWDATNFRPKYNIIMEGNASNAFYTWQNLAEPVDIGAILKAQDVTLDTSKATNLQNLFAYGSSLVGSLPTIDLSSAGSSTSTMFLATLVTTIEKLIVTTATSFTNMFNRCYNLENIVIEGTIAQNGLDLSTCKKLSGPSLESFVRALSETTTGLSVKFSTEAPKTFCKYLDQDSAWDDLIAQRDNWTFAYA
jgi:hypothetical protein